MATQGSFDEIYNFLLHSLSGSTAGSVSTLLLYPLENIKMRMQTINQPKKSDKGLERTPLKSSNNGSETSSLATTSKTPLKTPSRSYSFDFEEEKSFMDIVNEVMKKEGAAGFYKGITPLLIGNYVAYGIYFFWYEYFKKSMKVDAKNLLGYAKISGIAGVISTVLTNPMWVLNTKMALSKVNNFIENWLEI